MTASFSPMKTSNVKDSPIECSTIWEIRRYSNESFFFLLQSSLQFLVTTIRTPNEGNRFRLKQKQKNKNISSGCWIQPFPISSFSPTFFFHWDCYALKRYRQSQKAITVFVSRFSFSAFNRFDIFSSQFVWLLVFISVSTYVFSICFLLN
jgi:hypothetical protein